MVEELLAIGAAADLAEPAETAARRGNKKRAKTDRADASHRIPREHPITHHVTGPPHGEAAD